MGAVSCLEVEDQRRQDDAIVRAALEDRFKGGQVKWPWFPERRVRQMQREATLAARKAQQAEAEARRVEKRTRGLVDDQLVWLQEIKDVKPLRSRHDT